MTPTTIAKRISPMLATDDMEKTILFYQDVLGFAATMKSPHYSIIERDGQTIHYRLADRRVERLIGTLHELFCKGP